MPPAALRIAILTHEHDTPRLMRGYVISLMAPIWRQDGHDVRFVFGPRRFVPADVVIVHVDLSVVPPAYFEAAARYPIALNARVTDIRKSIVAPDLRVRREDGYDGPVVVKSDLNHAGLPERRRRGGVVRALLGRAGYAWPLSRKGNGVYRVFEKRGEVPGDVWDRGDLVVQRLVTERDGDRYCVRNMSFLGDRVSSVRLRGPNPIVNGGQTTDLERVEPHPDILAARERLGFDYGKFDYVVCDGQAYLLDANKTVGCSPRLLASPQLDELRRFRAEGLYSYFR